MSSHGARARLSAVIIADQRHRGGEIKRFAQPLGGAEKQKRAEIAGDRREHADDAPRLESPEDGGLAADAVHDVAGEGSADAIDQGERGAQQAELDFIEMQRLLEQRKNREDRLPVRIVEKPAKPEHADDVPLVVRAERDFRKRLFRVRGGLGVMNLLTWRGAPRIDSCIRARSSGRTFSLIHARISWPSRVSCGAERKSSSTPSCPATFAARTGHATPMSAVTGRLPSRRAKPDISMRNGMPVSLVLGNPRSTACWTCDDWRSCRHALSRFGSRSMRTSVLPCRL